MKLKTILIILLCIVGVVFVGKIANSGENSTTDTTQEQTQIEEVDKTPGGAIISGTVNMSKPGLDTDTEEETEIDYGIQLASVSKKISVTRTIPDALPPSATWILGGM